ncbi:MAG: bifunctional transaldolase/phosoglucose isomerase [Pyrinomonadaceae bacterium]
MSTPKINSDSLVNSVQTALESLGSVGAPKRIWDRDASFWKSEPEHQAIIKNALGWLTVPRMMSERVSELEAFVDEIRAAEFTHVMLLGMGGSSLCPEVFRRTFGHRDGYPELLVLDTTDPDTIADLESRVDLRWTLFIVASKSGSTIEPLSFYKYFYDRVQAIKGESAGNNFVAITDPGTLMERMATEANFRRIFLNPADIGGRYSALSYFGMLPAALMGVDVGELLRRAAAAMDECGPTVGAEHNPAFRLGALMGAAAAAGRDKLTIVADGDLESVGLWIEQLVAESTGKEGKGIIPIAHEDLGAPDEYGDDRLFAFIHSGAPLPETRAKLEALAAAGHPVVEHALDGPIGLGAEFFQWELATAVAGHLMSINPFDQPNVQESKDATNALLAEFKESGELPITEALATDGALSVYGMLPEDVSSVSTALSALMAGVKTGDYFAVLAYIQETEEHTRLLQAIRGRVQDKFKVATTVGYGPRFLHSTGQLHKGGPDSGVFLQITDVDAVDLGIPGEPYTFSVLKQAQASGDFTSLAKRNRRALRLDVGNDAAAGLRWLLEMVGTRA